MMHDHQFRAIFVISKVIYHRCTRVIQLINWLQKFDFFLRHTLLFKHWGQYDFLCFWKRSLMLTNHHLSDQYW